MSILPILLASLTSAVSAVRTVDPVAVSAGEVDFSEVRLRGTVVGVVRDDLDSRYNWLTLKNGGHTVFVSVTEADYPAAELRRLIDAEVEATGRVLPFCDWRQRLGSHLNLAGRNGIRQTVSPPDDPFVAPPLKDEHTAHRQRLDGCVVAVGTDRVVLRTTAGTIHTATLAAESARPCAGDRVTVVGFAEPDPFQLRLSEALVRIDGRTQPAVETVPLTDAESLFALSNGAEIVNAAYHGRFVRLRGRIQPADSSDRRSGLCRLVCGRREICADLTALLQANQPLPPVDSEIEVTGCCLAEFEDHADTALFRRFRHFTVIPRAPGDIRLVARPPWWTPQKLLIVILLLVGVVVLMVVWNRALNVVSERRGRELYRERIDHALAEQKVEERTRLAVELHDSISQTLTGVALQLDGRRIETAKRLLASCREELRHCLWDLRSRTFEEKDLTEAVERTIAPSVGTVRTTVRFNVPREHLSESTVHAILRIVRELAVNAVRHGRATHLRIAGEHHDGTISFSVRDDGCGFDPATAPGPAEGHFGLLGIRERLETFGGTLDIQSTPGAGTRATVTLNAAKDTCEP